MTIEAGKYYKARGSWRFYVAATNRNGDYPVVGWFDDGELCSFSINGEYSIGSKNNDDLISEWTDKPEVPWDKLFPAWVKWFAVDQNGEQYGFKEKPTIEISVWQSEDAVCQVPDELFIPYAGDWRESLTERTESKEGK